MFVLDKNVAVIHQLKEIRNMRSIELAIRRFHRDLDFTLKDSGEIGRASCRERV